ncbi:MAG: DNA sulfur modification protein DndD [Acidobacteriota bacterium]
MMINRLVLRNFGLFRGEQSLDLKVREGERHRPIVLVGGHNGSGKTTLLEAVRVCLHGRLALGSRVTDIAYQSYLRDRLHRASDLHSAATYASVGLEFEYSHLGKRSRYFVQRGWEPRGSTGVKEGIRVLRNGEPLDDVDSELWSEFVRSLVPPGVAQLFFFDGERIKRLAEEDTEALTLGESIKALLGLDLVERLQADLDVFSAKQAKRTARVNTARRLRELDKELKALHGELAKVEEDAARVCDEHAKLEAQLLKVEERLAQGGEGLASRREDLRQEEANLSAELGATEKSARDLLDGTAPFLLCQRTGARLVRQLELERARQDWEIGRAHAEEAIRTLRARLTAAANRRDHLDDNASQWVAQTIGEVQAELATEPEQIHGVRVLHGLSSIDRQACVQTLQVAAPALARRLSLHAKKLVALEGELRDCRTRMNRVPDAAELTPIVVELSALQEKQARAALDLTLLNERRVALQKEVAVRDRERNRLESAEIASKRASARLTLAAHAREAAAEYLRRLTVAKTIELERQALESFQRLSRKDDFVRRIRINPESFTVSLYDSKGEIIPKSSLSAGEKQIYAISLLWGMAKVSGRPLPMIVDTPLGRLDSHHRTNLLKHYFPAAAHQVIVLSTDTEVDRTHYDRLRPQTSHAYQLVDRQGWTKVEAGYFWETAHVDAHA